MIDAVTFSGEMNVSLQDPYVNMENRANYILWKKKVLTTVEASSIARDQKMRTANFSYGTMYSSVDDENDFKTVSSEKVVILNKKVVVINTFNKTLKTFFK